MPGTGALSLSEIHSKQIIAFSKLVAIEILLVSHWRKAVKKLQNGRQVLLVASRAWRGLPNGLDRESWMGTSGFSALLRSADVIPITSTAWNLGQTVIINTEIISREKLKGPLVTCTDLLQKLITIERSIGSAPNSTIREMVQDAQDCLLQMQKKQVEGFRAEAWRGRDAAA